MLTGGLPFFKHFLTTSTYNIACLKAGLQSQVCCPPIGTSVLFANFTLKTACTPFYSVLSHEIDFFGNLVYKNQ